MAVAQAPLRKKIRLSVDSLSSFGWRASPSKDFGLKGSRSAAEEPAL